MIHLGIENISVFNGDVYTLDNISFELEKGFTTVILGPSGSGKTLLLKVIGGILIPDDGKIIVDDVDVLTSSEEEEKSIRKKTSFVFQDAALLSNLTVFENLLLPLNFHFPELTMKEKKEKINNYMNLFRLDKILMKRPAEISQANRKITGFIRALITDPEILFIDEPFTYLDNNGKRIMLDELLKLKNKGISIVMVTQSFELVTHLVDYVVMVQQGKILEINTIEKVLGSEKEEIKKILKDYMTY